MNRAVHWGADRIREERGGVLVLAAVMIPVFILLTALVVDAGTWFTHKRQLQNRADAGALAAGVEYANRWAACVQTGDLVAKGGVAAQIEEAARRYAGDPDASGTLYNTEVTDQARVNVEINSTSSNFDENTSWNDPGIGGTGPCDPQPAGDEFSTAGNYWVDVKVKEVDQRSLFGAFGIDLFRNRAQARVELKTVSAGNKFIPIAVPDQLIEQAQIRYYAYCGSTEIAELGKATLHPLTSGYQPGGKTTFWAPTMNDDRPGTPTGMSITVPDESQCTGSQTIQIGAEVRVAGVGDTSIVDVNNATCAELQAARYADCWSRVSHIRVYKDNPRSEPWFQLVDLTSTAAGSDCTPDAYFARSTGSPCTYHARVCVNWNDLDEGGAQKLSDFALALDGGNLTRTGGGTSGCTAGSGVAGGIWEGNVTAGTLGRSDARVSWTYDQKNGTGPGGAQCRNGAQNPCKASGSHVVTSTFLADDDNAGILDLVRTAPAPQTGNAPAGPLGWLPAALGQGTTMTVYPTVGLNAALNVQIGQRRVLRVSNSQFNQSVDCEPGSGGQGHDFQMFLNGCDPWYGINPLTGPPWWDPSTKSCPDRNAILAQPNSTSAPWRCVIKAPGFSPPVVADGIAAAIGNCDRIQSNSCAKYVCANPNVYPTWKTSGGNTLDPRIVRLFIVPYGAYKNTGPQEGLPILNFAAFYVTGWNGQGAGNRNPCGSNDGDGEESTGAGEIAGYFVDWTEPGAPYDPQSTCVQGQLTPCTAALVR